MDIPNHLLTITVLTFQLIVAYTGCIVIMIYYDKKKKRMLNDDFLYVDLNAQEL
jgi:hypothetical protein